MTEIAFLLAIASFAYTIARILRLPEIPVFIAAGMSLSLTGIVPKEFGLGNSVSEGATDVLEFGLIFLVFASGIELSPQRFKKFGNVVIWTAFIQFFSALTIGILSAKWFGMNWLESTYLGAGLAASSTLIVIRQLRSRKAMVEPFGRVVTGVVLLQDVLLVIMIVILSRINDGNLAILSGLGSTCFIGTLAWVLQKFIMPGFIGRLKPDEENLLLWLVALLLCFVSLTKLLNLPLISGAFAAGFIFSAFPLNGLLRGQITSLVAFFQSMFFVALGAMLGIPGPEIWLQSLGYSAVAIFITPPLVALVTEWRGLTARSGIEAGLLLAQTSEYSLLLGLSGLALGHLNSDIFSILALTTIITMSITSYLSKEEIATFLLGYHPLKRKKKIDTKYEDHILILGFGSAGMWLLKPLLSQGFQVLVVDDDAIVCNELNKRAIDYIRGDGSDPMILEKAGAKRAKLIIASMRRTSDSLKVIRSAKNIPIIARVFEIEEANQIKKAGVIPVMSSQAAADQFMKWFETTPFHNER